eukprot:Gb_19951 [translate_table: standard]
MNGETEMHEVDKTYRHLGQDSYFRALLLSFWYLHFVLNFTRLPLCSSLTVDGISLFELKKSVRGHPSAILSNWNENDADPCLWTGVTCSTDSRRVIALNISGISYCKGVQPFAICPLNGSSGERGEQIACKLKGTLSGYIGNLTELRILSLPSNAFFGVIPAEIGKLSLLEVLELQGNSFTGPVPLELSKLPSLRVLNIAYNSLVGEIPKELVKCFKLQTLNLAGNMLNGSIPRSLGRLRELKVLSLSYNQLSGSIPSELASGCLFLEYFHLSGNLLTGEIPPQLGNCSRLRSISVFSNILEGKIPAEIGRLSMLESLDVSRNSLIGEIPKELANCLNLSVLVLTNLLDFTPAGEKPSDNVYSPSVKREYNAFDKGIPVNLATLPRIQIIWAPRAGLSGHLPLNWGDCDSLEVLSLSQNSITGHIPAGLGKCKRLFFLDLSYNPLQGNIPEQLPVPCMLFFNVSGSSLSGTIPTFKNASCPKQGQPLFPTNQPALLDVLQSEEDLAFFYSTLFYCGTWAGSPFVSIVSRGLVVFHDLSWNNFTGLVPPSLIGDRLLKERPSYKLLLNSNKLMGNISSELFASCQSLQSFALNLNDNQISGEIPAQVLVNCKSLKQFEATFNQIRGSIPPTIGNLESLMYLDLSSNNLHGIIPPQLGQLKNLQYLLLAENNITGEIPGELGQLSSLVMLDLSSNALTGKIPVDLARLAHLKILLLDTNRLSGQIPKVLTNLTALTTINVSFNNLSGSVPHIGNSKTCKYNFTGNQFLDDCPSASFSSSPSSIRAPLPHTSLTVVKPDKRDGGLNSLEVAALISASAIVFVLVVLVLLLSFARRCIRRPGCRSGRKDVVTFTNIGVQLTYENVVRATGNFSVGNLIGNGGFGATYKAELTPGLLVAVKRLSVGRFQGIQQFDAEIRTLGRIRHENLVTLIGYHASESEMFLVYNYLPGGNLESFIHERSNRNVHWRILHKIALDIAQALHYLHDFCVPRVLHRDIKPSNILLDNNLNAYLSDFGLARLLEASETHATTDVAGTFGYVAPEYAMTCRVSDKADVYSYGVVLLELLSGKKSLDPSFSSYGNGFNIVAWACMLLKEGRAREVFTPGLWDTGPRDDLVESLHLAVMCTVDLLSGRPSMRKVVEQLRQFQPPPLS